MGSRLGHRSLKSSAIQRLNATSQTPINANPHAGHKTGEKETGDVQQNEHGTHDSDR